MSNFINPAADVMTSDTALNASFRAALAEAGEPRLDPIRRFLPTPYCGDLPLMRRTIHVETNHPKLLQHMRELFARYPEAPGKHPDFIWRIVVESDTPRTPPWPQRTAFSDPGVRFAAFGQRNFLAVDLDTRQAIGILSEGLMKDELGLTSPFLDNLFCLTASSLGLVPIWANCVASGQNALLLFGDSSSGKTCTSYIAEKMGLIFHADEGVFVESDCKTLLSWSGFWPPAFRPEALQLYPQLQTSSRPYFYRNVTVYYRTEQPLEPAHGLPVKPVCCLFLERQASAVPSLLKIPPSALVRRLDRASLFKDDDRFEDQYARVLQALAGLPAYVLRYSEPAFAARTARDLLAGRTVAEFAG